MHYLVLSVLVGSVAAPIYWVQLEKIGVSCQAERKAMFEAIFSLLYLKGMTLLVDREYIGKIWVKFLKENKIHFVIRLRVGDYFEDVNTTKGKDYRRMQGKCASKNHPVAGEKCIHDRHPDDGVKRTARVKPGVILPRHRHPAKSGEEDDLQQNRQPEYWHRHHKN